MCTFKNSLLKWNDCRPLFSHMTMLCLMPEVESTLIWNNSAWNPPQYFVENNWVVCLLSCISQSGSPFTLTCILTTPKRNCLDQFDDEYYKPLHRKFLKIMYIYSQSKSFDLLTSFNWKQVTRMNQSPSSRYLQSSSKLLGRLLLALACFSSCFQNRI